jgi:hypothetical protein
MGMDITTSTVVPTPNQTHGRRWMMRLHRNASVSRIGFSRRGGTLRRMGATTTLASRVRTTPSPPTALSTGMPRPRPSSAIDAKPAAIRPRQRVTSTRSRVSEIRAGRRVIEATSVVKIVVAAAMPMPATNSSPINNIPSSETTTVMPANTTARPAVFIAPSMARSGRTPARVSSR